MSKDIRAADEPPLSNRERRHAVDVMVDRLGALSSLAGERIPVARPIRGDWLLSRRGSWSAGCWAAALHLRALVLDEPGAVADDHDGLARLSRSLTDDTSARATVFWLGAATRADGLGVDVAEDAARRVAATFDPLLGVVPDGTALGRGEAGRRRATIDAGFAVNRLLHWAGARGLDGAAHIARRHTDVLLNGVDSDGAAHQLFGGGPPVRPEGTAGTWARGQAWALLTAVAAGADPHDPSPHPTARGLAAHRARWTAPPPDDLALSTGPLDTGAAAIDALALLGLAVQDIPRREHHHAQAESIVAILVRRHLDDQGVLHDGAYQLGLEGAEPVESVWGLFFLLAAVLVLEGVIPADRYA